MKAEINNENKARFFALYFRQEIMGTNDFPSPQDCFVAVWHVDKYYLNLKPLSAITEEDANAIDLTDEHFNERGFFGKSPIDDSFYYWSFEDADFLRSKGYAIPFMGLSVDEMVKAGWIKLMEQ